MSEDSLSCVDAETMSSTSPSPSTPPPFIPGDGGEGGPNNINIIFGGGIGLGLPSAGVEWCLVQNGMVQYCWVE